jgi:hypothetical protein
MNNTIQIPVNVIKAVKRLNYSENIRPLCDRTFQVRPNAILIINPYFAIVVKKKFDIDKSVIIQNHKLQAVLQDSIFKGKNALPEVPVEKSLKRSENGDPVSCWIAGEKVVGSVMVEDVSDEESDLSTGLEKVKVAGEYRTSLSVDMLQKILSTLRELGVDKVAIYTGGKSDPAVLVGKKYGEEEVVSILMPLRYEDAKQSISTDLKRVVEGESI